MRVCSGCKSTSLNQCRFDRHVHTCILFDDAYTFGLLNLNVCAYREDATPLFFTLV
jgi:hypothetical protein